MKGEEYRLGPTCRHVTEWFLLQPKNCIINITTVYSATVSFNIIYTATCFDIIEPNPLYSLASITNQHLTLLDTHPDSVHARPTH